MKNGGREECYDVAHNIGSPTLLADCGVGVHVFLSPQVSKSRAQRVESAANTRVRILGFCRGDEEKAAHSAARTNIHKSRSVKRV